MSYEKQNFADGQVLEAEHLNKMEEGIAKANGIIVTEGTPDTLTWDGNTEGLEEAVEGSGCYKVSSATPTLDDFSNGVEVESNGATITVPSEAIMEIVPGYLAIGEYVIVALSDNIHVESGITIRSKGLYFAPGTTSITIPGYTGFAKEKIDPAVLPEALQFGDTAAELLPETEITGTAYGDYFEAEIDASFLSGDEADMFVTLDGIKYRTEMEDFVNGIRFAGNLGLAMGTGVGDGEPFAMTHDIANNKLRILFASGATHWLSIDKITVVKMNDRYLPEHEHTAKMFYVTIVNNDCYIYSDSARENKASVAELAAAKNNPNIVFWNNYGSRLLPLEISADSVAVYGEVVLWADASPKRYYTAEYTPES